LIAGLIAAVATAWAALLALAEEAATVPRTLGEPPSESGQPVPLGRAFHIGRLSLLIVAGVAAADAVVWWKLSTGRSLGTALVAGLFVFMLGDALPRALGAISPGLAANAVSASRSTLWVFKPLFGLIAAADRLVHHVLPSRRRKAGELGSAQRDMLQGVLSLDETTVADIMTPRLDIVAIESKASWSEVVELVRRNDHSRIPVYHDSLDDIAGVLFAKDLAPAVAGATAVPTPWQEMVRQVHYVPEVKPLASQLRDFQPGPGHLAIVVDEFGGTSGLITLEDVLEEIVGEIHDEYDVDETPPIQSEGDEKFWVDGRLTLDELSEALGSDLEHEEVSTVGGLVYTELGRVPRPGEELRIDGFRVVVEQVVRRRLQRVYFERLTNRVMLDAPPEDA
jgi:CBS domain containing-hemolysin-like protein